MYLLDAVGSDLGKSVTVTNVSVAVGGVLLRTRFEPAVDDVGDVDNDDDNDDNDNDNDDDDNDDNDDDIGDDDTIDSSNKIKPVGTVHFSVSALVGDFVRRAADFEYVNYLKLCRT